MGTPLTYCYQATIINKPETFLSKLKCPVIGTMDYLAVLKTCQHVVAFTSVDAVRFTTQLNILGKAECCTSSLDVSPPAFPSWCSEERPGRSTTLREIRQMML